MSKGNMLLGHARGKVGSLVFSRSNGKQITRARAEVVKNPQSEAQMIQRIILNTISQAYSAMNGICDHSFEGVSVGQASMSYFMKRNMDALRARVSKELSEGSLLSEIVAFTPLKTNYFAPNDYEISKGTLPVVNVVTANEDEKMAIVLPTNTYAAVLWLYGLQRGDQLTFIGVDGEATNDLRFNYCRVILDPRDENGAELPLSTPLVVDGAINKPSPRNEGNFGKLVFEDSQLKFGFFQTYMVDAAVIVSRQNAQGTWLRSNAKLIANTDSVIGFYSMQDCLDAIQAGGISVLSPRFLNNAGRTRMATTSPTTGARITGVTLNGSAITKGSSQGLQAGSYVMNVANLEDGVTYQAVIGHTPDEGTFPPGDNDPIVQTIQNGAATIAVTQGQWTGSYPIKLWLAKGTGNSRELVETWCTFTEASSNSTPAGGGSDNGD